MESNLILSQIMHFLLSKIFLVLAETSRPNAAQFASACGNGGGA